MLNLFQLFHYLWSEDGHGLPLNWKGISAYWSHTREHMPWGAQHPASDQRIPCAIYGDEARYTSATGVPEKILAILVSFPLFSPRSTRNSKFCVFAMRCSLMVKRKTLWRVFEYIRYAMNFLFNGHKPSHPFPGCDDMPRSDMATYPGEPLFEKRPLKFALTELRGDWAWFMDILNLKPRWNSAQNCFKCGAWRNASTLGQSGYDFSDSALWPSTIVTHVQFIATKLNEGPI